MIWLTKPLLAAAAMGYIFMGAAIVHYKMLGTEALERLEKQSAQTQIWLGNADTLRGAVDEQNRALNDMKREQELKDAQNALALARAKEDTKQAQKRAQSLATREKPADVPACTAASQLFDEVLHGSK